MLLTKEVEVKLCSRNIKHYQEKGYDCKIGNVITVKVEDLSHGSSIKVDVLCDYCKTEILHMPYYEYKKNMDKTGTCACCACKFIKVRETNLKKYGVPCPFMVDEFKQKSKDTLLKRYGEDCYLKTKECQDKTKTTNMSKYGVEYTGQREDVKAKIRESNLQKYGVENAMQSNEIQERLKKSLLEKYNVDNYAKTKECQDKKKKTNMQRYGVECSFQNEEVKEKFRKNNLLKYGVENPMQLNSIKEEWAKGMYGSDKTCTSKQQLYLHDLYGGELNYPISYYLADICFPDEKIDIEYNGGGHDLSVKIGQVTQGQFNQKEYCRSFTVKSKGYKIMTIISSKDYLPSDEILLKMLEQARTYFNTTTHTWIEYNIDTSMMRNAENKNGVYFDFGDLKKIKQAS